MKIILPPRKRRTASQGSDTFDGNGVGSGIESRSESRSESGSESGSDRNVEVSNLFRQEPTVKAASKKLRAPSLEENSRPVSAGLSQPASSNNELPPGKKRRRSELDIQSQQVDFLEPEPAKKEFNKVLERGIRLLAMREHSVREIYHKLSAKTDNSQHVAEVVDRLVEKKYLSDERFSEAYVRARGARGFGPAKIRNELKNKGVSSILISAYVDENAAHWLDSAEFQYQKKFGETAVVDFKEWSKRARFLQNRGFSSQHIQCVIPQVNQD